MSGLNNLIASETNESSEGSNPSLSAIKIFEGGLIYSPSGWTKYIIYWSDGSITEEKRPCQMVIKNMDLIF